MVRARVTKLDEYQFLTCVKHGVWGSEKARFSDWQEGDLLFFLVENRLAGYAKVSGAPYVSRKPVWHNGVFPHRLPLRFIHVSLLENRSPVLGQVRDTLAGAYKSQWGLGIVNQWLMEGASAEKLLSVVRATPNALKDLTDNIEQFLLEAKVAREARAQRKRRAEPAAPVPESDTPSEAEDESAPLAEAERLHSRAQHALIRLGQAVGCSVWIASNDRKKTYAGKRLGDQCLPRLPNLGLSEEANRHIGRIDVIWIRKSAPLCAFEVETTTSVYSGLLRMSDLVEVVPALKMRLYIVGPRAREEKVMKELARPTFRRIGLNDVCKFVAIEELDALVVKVTGLQGHVEPTIIETIAEAAPEEQAAIV